MKKALASIAASLAQPPSGQLHLQPGESFPVKLRRDPGGIVVGNPAIASVRITDATTLLITGKTSGATTVLVRDEIGRELWTMQISVKAVSNLKVA